MKAWLLSSFLLAQTPCDSSIELSADQKKFVDSLISDDQSIAYYLEKDSCPIVEKYADGFSKDSLFLLWSITKSVTSIIFGFAERQGLISREESHPNKKDRSLNSFLSFSSGLNWHEGYEASPISSDILQLLYGRGIGNIRKFVLKDRDFESPAFSRWHYNSGDSNALIAALKTAVEKEHSDFFHWLENDVFSKLGIKRYVWERDQQGLPIASSYLYLSARDLAKLGRLMIDDQGLLPSGWRQYLTSPPKLVEDSSKKTIHGFGYGGKHWWLNSVPGKPKAWKGLPENSFSASGHWGQIMTIIPEENFILIRFARDREAMKLKMIEKSYELFGEGSE